MNQEREQREQHAIDELFPTFYQKMDDVRKRINEIDRPEKEKAQLPNPAITLNNKIVEIGQQYIKRDMGFYSESSLKSVILSSLMKKYEKAYEKLELAVKVSKDPYFYEDYEESLVFDNFLKKTNANKYHSPLEIVYDSYNKDNKEIELYSIQNNIVSDILDRYNNYKDKNIANEMLEKYKIELKDLGYNDLVVKLERQIDRIDSDIER